MNAEFIRNYADKTRPVIQELAEISGTFITGSAAIGGFKMPESDIDVVVPIQFDDSIKFLTKKFNSQGFILQSSNYCNGFKVVIPGASIPVNIITLHPFDYCAWLFATNTLAELEYIRDRNARHRAFELAVLLFKTTNTSGLHTTITGADVYFETHKHERIIDAFDRLINRQMAGDQLPF